MGTLSVTLPDGRSGAVNVDDSFASLSDADKQDFISHIQDQLGSTNSFSADIQGGLHDLGQSVSQGLHVAGGIMQRNGMPQWGGAVSSAGDSVAGITPNAPAGPAPSQQVADDLKNGNWSSLPGHALHAALRAAPSTAPILAAGAVGGPVGAGLAAGALAEGPEAYARAQNNGRSEPTTEDAVEAIPGAAGEAVGGALIPGESKLASPVLRAARKVGSEALGGAVSDVAGQLGGSVGTDAGTQLDPYQVAASGVTQGALGGARVAKEAAGAAVTEGARAAGALPSRPSSPEEAASIVRVNQAIQDAQAGIKSYDGRDASYADAANTVRKDVTAQFGLFGKQLRDSGTITPADYNATFAPFFEQVSRHNSSPFSSEGGDQTALDRMQALLGRDPGLLKQFNDFTQDLNTLSQAARQNRQTGPLERAARAVGTVAGVASGVATGSALGPVGAVAGGIGGLMAHSPATAIAGRIGALGDKVMGWQAPVAVQRAKLAQAMLDKTGQAAGPTPLQNVQSMLTATRPTVMDNTPAPASPDQLGSQAAARNQAALVAKLGPDHPVGSAALDSLTQGGFGPLAQQALQQWNSMASVRDAQARTAQRAADAEAQAKQTAEDTAAQAKRDRQVRQSDLEAALGRRARVTNAVDTAANRNEDTLQAAEELPHVDDASLPAINAAVNQAVRRANAVKAMGGAQVTEEAPQAPAQAPEPSPAPTPAATPPEAAQPATAAPQQPSGLLPLAEYMRHVAMARHGAAITPEQVSAGLDALAAKGGVTPDQYDFYKAALNAPLMNPGGIHTPILEAITAHAVGARNGGAVPEVVQAAARRAGAQPDQSGVRNPLSYAHNLRQEAAIADAIVKQHPELADAVNKIRDPQANGKTKQGRAAVLAQIASKLPKGSVTILRPLTAFGQD